MNSDSALIQWKTNAWKDPGFVHGYSQRMDDTSGPVLLKNRVETGIFQRFVKGRDVLDVGIGTGRASLPLARQGRNVTGVDSSQAMLDKCRELAKDTPITLQPGDVTRLPFEDRAFDTVMSLNTMTHFPHWKAILGEWSRVVRPGGEILFDVYSLDHDIAFARATGRDDDFGVSNFAPKEARSYYLRIRLEELLQFASASGLRVRAIVPYSVFLGSAGFNRFFEGSPVHGHRWDRLLSWVRSDQLLFDFLTFLEESIVAHLPSAAACRFMAVFDAVADPDANQAFLARNQAYLAELASGFSFAAFERSCAADAATIRARLNAFLSHEPNRFALAAVLFADRRWNWIKRPEEWIDAPYLPQLMHLRTLESLDEIVLELIRSLASAPPIREILEYRGVPLARALAYDIMPAVLSQCGAFSSSFGESQ